MSRIIIAQFSDGRIELYSSIVVFLSHHPGRNYHTIMSYLCRRNIPYSDHEVKLTRISLTNKKKKTMPEFGSWGT